MTPTIGPAVDAGQEAIPDPARAAEGSGALSPPTHRVVRVLELLSRYASERLSLARIVREAGLSRATAHAVLAQLTADGWTVRDDDGCYGIGLRLLTVARRAESAFPLRRTALPHLRALSEQVGVPVFLAERDGENIVVTEVVGNPSAGWIRQGRRLPLAPPVCREFIAWAPESARTAWLATADPAHRDRLAGVLTEIRARGYSVERLVDDSTPMLEALAGLRDSPITAALRAQLGSVITDLITIDYLPDELGAENAVVTLAAPIRDRGGAVVAAVVSCPDSRLTKQELNDLGAATSATADRIATGGEDEG
ncbi:IclR family transcriptional regulator [Nocardia mangyaensis]|uniref:IclR family transcriptional regulator n=1 Tax=Nocardia mangyaensis TaxID=2213200 RepID=UPI00267533B5|nr:IclR family transcriptional regulator C-terminal domain-containing protein [Nocardia mangyaensis]MDO3646472.1 IclR family transcriptional regulator C-terminal domain-containing protein [Nocardia mangyaensis]